MAKEIKNEQAEAVVEAVSKTERFFQENGKRLAIISAVFVALCVVVFCWFKFAYQPKVAEAQGQMAIAEQNFRAGNYEVALNGDGNALGFVHHTVLGNQRMPRLLQTDDAPVVDDGLGGAHGVRQIRLGENQAELRQIVVAADDGIREVARVGGQLKEDALNFLLLLVFQQLDVVIRLHHAHRLNKHRLAAGGGVVHQSGDVVAALRANGHNIPAVALGNDGVL